MKTTYRYFAGKQPIQLSTSWEPLSIIRGTPVEYPEDGPLVGVIPRMDSIGQRISEVVEKVTARAAVPDETERLQLRADSAYVIAIERTYFAGEKPVETCDIIFPGDRYELTYRIPVK